LVDDVIQISHHPKNHLRFLEESIMTQSSCQFLLIGCWSAL